MRNLRVEKSSLPLAFPPQEESKLLQPSSETVISPIKAAKATIRKLQMFDTYSAKKVDYDFEWPNKSVLKGITQVKQLRLKEIRYQQDALGIITAIKMVAHDASSPFFSASLDKKAPPIVLSMNSFYDN